MAIELQDAHRQLSAYAARRYGRGNPDARGVCDEVLVRAALTYDQAFGIAFSTHAVWKMRHALRDLTRRWLREQGYVRRGRTWHLKLRFRALEAAAGVAAPGRSPEDEAQLEEARRLLLAACPTRHERRILEGYLEGLTLKDCGRLSGVGEARASQIVAAVVARVRAQVSA